MNNLEFVTELMKQEEKPIFSSGFRCFKSLKAGRYSMSIQGSTGHYCTPREILSADEYVSMEIALFRDGKWLRVSRSKVLKAFPRYAELADRAEDLKSSSCVFGWVPVDLINDLYLYLLGRK